MMVLNGTPYYVPLLLIAILRYVPQEINYFSKPLEAICDYDNHVLCKECFPTPLNCNAFDRMFVMQEDSWVNRINGIFNSHTTRLGTVMNENRVAVMKHMNKDNTIEKLHKQYCDRNSQSNENCKWSIDGSVEQAKLFLTESILDNDRIEGCIFCPTSVKRKTLQRFLTLLEPAHNDLWNLLAIRTNVEPLLLELLSKSTVPFPVPKLLHTIGFSFIESYDGKTLEHYYDHSFDTRMLIAAELIKAAFMFTEGIDGFRVYLTDINPDNVVVRFGNNGTGVYISIVDLDNVIILDSRANPFATDHSEHVHGRIECNRCFAYVQEDVCRHQISDLNLFAACQLLLDNPNGQYAEGLLHNDRYGHGSRSSPAYVDASQTLHKLLQECVYCQPPLCRNRSTILMEMLNVIDRANVQ